MPRKKTMPANKIFVLDTNVLLHDPNSLFKFAEHDLFIPFVTLEELDGKKAGPHDVNRNARQATRLLDEVVSQKSGSMAEGYALSGFNGGQATGRLYVQREPLPFLSNEHIRKNDNLYLSVLAYLTDTRKSQQVVMVTKDLNLRIKAKAMGFAADDYLHDHAIEDADLMYAGLRHEDSETFFQNRAPVNSGKLAGGRIFYEVSSFPCVLNEYICLDNDHLYRVRRAGEGTVRLESVRDTRRSRDTVEGINARNAEQQAALDLLLDPEIDFVTLLGPAGTGKTLLALAAGVSQVAQDELYSEIMFTRATIPLGEDIGFLPGSEEEKMAPWLGALYDNLDVIAETRSKDSAQASAQKAILREMVKIKAITFMRGRTLHRKFVVIDEAQNLTPKQMKALITRAGAGTKVVCLGNLAQIDSPYLSETSSGLAYAVERFKGWPHFGSLILQTGERSRLASEGNERL